MRYRRCRIEALEEMAVFFDRLAAVTELTGYEIISVMKSMCRKTVKNDIAEKMVCRYTPGTDISALWDECISLSDLAAILPQKARICLSDFSGAFGKRSIEYFHRYCRRTEEELSELLDEEKEKFRKTGGLISALSLLTGAVMIIIFI